MQSRKQSDWEGGREAPKGPRLEAREEKRRRKAQTSLLMQPLPRDTHILQVEFGVLKDSNPCSN